MQGALHWTFLKQANRTPDEYMNTCPTLGVVSVRPRVRCRQRCQQKRRKDWRHVGNLLLLFTGLPGEDDDRTGLRRRKTGKEKQRNIVRRHRVHPCSLAVRLSRQCQAMGVRDAMTVHGWDLFFLGIEREILYPLSSCPCTVSLFSLLSSPSLFLCVENESSRATRRWRANCEEHGTGYIQG